MTKIEALRLELAAREMVEGTPVKWKDVIRVKETKQRFYPAWARNNEKDSYELALRVLEGKPVWEGDKLYFPDGTPIEVRKSTLLCKKEGGLFDLSWNPPKPKTVLVELLVEDACDLARPSAFNHQRIMEACRKALEVVK